MKISGLVVVVAGSLISSQIAVAQGYNIPVSPPASTPVAGPPGMQPVPLVPTATPATVLVQDYRLELLAADLGTLAAVIVSQRGEVFLAGYLGAAPLVHMAHGNVGRGLASAGLRGGLPFLGAYLGAGLTGEKRDSYDAIVGVALGGLAGMSTALVIDWLILGRATKNVDAPARGAGLSVAPALSVGQDGSMRVALTGAW